MTLKEFYDSLEPLVQKFHDEAGPDASSEVNAASSIANFFMAVLYRCVVMNDSSKLAGLAMCVGFHMLQTEPELLQKLLSKTTES